MNESYVDLLSYFMNETVAQKCTFKTRNISNCLRIKLSFFKSLFGYQTIKKEFSHLQRPF